MKKEFEIIETDRAMYQEFYNIKANKGFSLSTKCLMGLIGVALFVGGALLNLVFLDSSILILTCGVGLYGGLALTIKLGEVLENIKKKNKLKKFQEKYPAFDLDTEVSEVKEKLIEYRMKNIPIYSLARPHEVTEEEKHLSFYTSDFSDMTAQEKIAFLESEKEFWSQYLESERITEKEEAFQKKQEF